MRSISEIITAVASGNLSYRITLDSRGEILELKHTINEMLEGLNSFTSQITRVVREVNVEGKLGGQAAVKGMVGTWKDVTEDINTLVAYHTGLVRETSKVTATNGDLSKRISLQGNGEHVEFMTNINSMLDQFSLNCTKPG